MSDGQDQEAEGAEAAAQEHAVAGQEAQEKGQALKIDPPNYHNMIASFDRIDNYDAQDDAEAIKLWLWYR